jgi:N-acetylmuramoyl-L-alanine amidase
MISFMRIKLLFFLVLFAAANLYPQRFLKMSVQTGDKTERISYLTKNEISYVPVSEFAKVLNAPVYLNKEASKAEVKFDEYKIKITGRNQFIILTDASAKQKIYQIPVSTLLINDEIYVPVLYTAELFSTAANKDISIDEGEKNITIKNSPAAKKTTERGSTAEKAEPAPVNSKYDIYGIEMEEKSNGTLVRLKSSKRLTIPKNSVSNNTLFVFFNNVTLIPNITKQLKAAGLVKKVQTRYITPKNIQLEFELAPNFSSQEISYSPDNNDILIALHNKVLAEPEKTNVEGMKTKWMLDAIVIDAGHGGKDAGAIGVSGIKEKDVNLAVALKLGNLIKKEMPGVNVVYTRSDDTFIELYKRGKIANESGGKLFISIHCNSLPKKPSDTRGFEVYLLRLGKTQDAIEIAEFENSVIKYEDNPARYKKLTDENFIFVSMAHSAFMRFSESFSDLLNQTWKKEVPTPSRGVKQAGFLVLVGASMPSVLIETGFLSNPQEEKFLNSGSGQSDVAAAIFKSIKQYKSFYESSVLEKPSTTN